MWCECKNEWTNVLQKIPPFFVQKKDFLMGCNKIQRFSSNSLKFFFIWSKAQLEDPILNMCAQEQPKKLFFLVFYGLLKNLIFSLLKSS
jgi:hypothetical protein